MPTVSIRAATVTELVFRITQLRALGYHAFTASIDAQGHFILEGADYRKEKIKK